MDLVICFKDKNEAPWKQALEVALPGVRVYAHGKVPNASRVSMALCWYPDKNLFSQYPNLKLIQSVGAGVDHLFGLDPAPTTVRIARIVDSTLSRDMYEFTLAIVLDQMKNLSKYWVDKASKVWEPRPYKRIEETKIAIIGLGKIGAELAISFSRLGFIVSGYSSSDKVLANVDTYYGIDQLELALLNADFVVNILPLTSSTKGFFDLSFFRLCKKEAFFINVGRGAHLVEDDLEAAIGEQRISGAFLDVFAEEPLPQDHFFWSNPSIRISPHVAAVTNTKSAVQQIAENYKRTESGMAPLNEVSLHKGY
jgi:glyoxylate/hydroxypyruvate reductase A